MREILALGQRLIALMRKWALSPQGRRAIEMEAEGRRARCYREREEQRTKVEMLKERSQRAEDAARAEARQVLALRQRMKELQDASAFDNATEEELAEAEKRFEKLTSALDLARKRVARADNRLKALETRATRPLSQWRLTVFKSLERTQRRKALRLVVEKNRRRAFRHGWRRLWDGEDGEDFAAWAEHLMQHRRTQALAILREASSDEEDPEGYVDGVSFGTKKRD